MMVDGGAPLVCVFPLSVCMGVCVFICFCVFVLVYICIFESIYSEDLKIFDSKFRACGRK